MWPLKQFCLSPNILFVGIMFSIATIFSLIALFVFTFIGCKTDNSIKNMHKQHLRNKLDSSCRFPSTTLRLFNVPANFKEGFFFSNWITSRSKIILWNYANASFFKIHSVNFRFYDCQSNKAILKGTHGGLSSEKTSKKIN